MPAADTQAVGFRLPIDMIERIDRCAKHLGEQASGVKVTRTQCMMVLLSRALDDFEKEQETKKKRK